MPTPPWELPGPLGGPVLAGPAPAAGLASGSIVLAWLVTGGLVLLAVAGGYSEDTWVEAAQRGESYIGAGFTPFLGVSLIIAPLVVAAYVVACLWLQASRAFVAVRNPSARRRRSTGWIWFAWFVPVVQIWFPYEVVRDVERATVRGRRAFGAVAWWLCWLMGLLLIWSGYQWTGGFLGADPLTDSASSIHENYTVLAGFAVIACALWTRIVVGVRNGQRAMVAGLLRG
ncbi:DUF4328 domain-containing protein [Antribacter gilvus]|uniref:DUF4328 domain-containing protein n=1 Tax=Antribacter gilvus TaxID=2304675 RepID=UPI0013DF7B6A|nr:DUF4328 domain-containing protein [Antribacter gilvus]